MITETPLGRHIRYTRSQEDGFVGIRYKRLRNLGYVYMRNEYQCSRCVIDLCQGVETCLRAMWFGGKWSGQAALGTLAADWAPISKQGT